MKVNILGTTYSIEYVSEESDSRIEECYGFTDSSVKEIGIRRLEEQADSLKDMKSFEKKVARHEIVHAFMEESGLREECSFARNEELIDWIAIQLPKIVLACEEAKALY